MLNNNLNCHNSCCISDPIRLQCDQDNFNIHKCSCVNNFFFSISPQISKLNTATDSCVNADSALYNKDLKVNSSCNKNYCHIKL